MTPDLEAIDHLSQRYEDSAGKLDRHSSGDHAIILSDYNPIIEQGEKVLHMFEAELAKAPYDKDVRSSLARHLRRMGYLYYDALMPGFLPINRPIKKDDRLETDAAKFAEKSCMLMVRSFETNPNATAAFILADIFYMCRFYATALYWYSNVESISDDHELVVKAKAKRLEMQADGKAADPVLFSNSGFPTRMTAGLLHQVVSPGYAPVAVAAPEDRRKNASSSCFVSIAALCLSCMVVFGYWVITSIMFHNQEPAGTIAFLLTPVPMYFGYKFIKLFIVSRF